MIDLDQWTWEEVSKENGEVRHTYKNDCGTAYFKAATDRNDCMFAALCENIFFGLAAG